MKQIGLLKAIYLASRYPRLSMEQKQTLRQERLNSLVSYARKYSPYFERLYRNIPGNAELSELPPTFFWAFTRNSPEGINSVLFPQRLQYLTAAGGRSKNTFQSIVFK